MKTISLPEEIFLEHITTLINNLLIKNINYDNGYYHKEGKYISDVIGDTKERAIYILEEIENTKHLIMKEIK